MAKKSESGKDELLVLLKRAADELKHAQEESRTAIAALRKEKAAHAETEAELEALKARLGPAKSRTERGERGETATHRSPSSDVPKVEAAKPAAEPLAETTQATSTDAAPGPLLDDLRSELSRQQARIDGFKRDLETAQVDLQREQQRAEAAEASLRTAHGERDGLLTRVAELEAQAIGAAAGAAGEREGLLQAHRDELKAEVDKREALERAHAEALAARAQERAELEAAQQQALAATVREHEELELAHAEELGAGVQERLAQQRAHEEALAAKAAEHAQALEQVSAKLKAAEAALAHEKEKHSLTAQKLLESRAAVRELEGAVSQERERVKALDLAAQRASGEAQKVVEAVQAQLDAASAELARATGEWQHVERQYEQLHKEMLLVLEQRDEAREQLSRK